MRTTRTGVMMTLCLIAGSAASAQSLIVGDSGGQLDYGYGYADWTGFTNDLNANFASVTVVTTFENLAQLLAADSILVDQRWTNGALSALEVSNLSTCIASGKRVLLVGENSTWQAWNDQILGIVGGSFAGDGGGILSVVNPDPILTAGVNSIQPISPGLAGGGTSLFTQNVATLWGSNVMTLLDVNVVDDTFAGLANNRQFAKNTAKWLSVPTPGSLPLLVVAALGARRRRG
jgi:hypothetical protein